jgi:hypothetical protein
VFLGLGGFALLSNVQYDYIRMTASTGALVRSRGGVGASVSALMIVSLSVQGASVNIGRRRNPKQRSYIQHDEPPDSVSFTGQILDNVILLARGKSEFAKRRHKPCITTGVSN